MSGVVMVGKLMMLSFWLAEFANLFKWVPPPWDGVLHTAALILLGLHLVLGAIFTRRHAQLLLEPKLHKMMILLFGLFHWLDLQQKGKLRKTTG